MCAIFCCSYIFICIAHLPFVCLLLLLLCCLLVAFTFIGCTAFKFCYCRWWPIWGSTATPKMHVNVVLPQAQEGPTWWQPLSPPGGPDMQLFMCRCHLHEKSMGVPDMRLFYGSMSPPYKTRECLTCGSVMGHCHLLIKHGSAWHAALLWVNVISLNRSVDMQLCHSLVIVSAPCCERCNTLLPVGVASHISEGISTCGHPVPMLVMPLWSRAL